MEELDPKNRMMANQPDLDDLRKTSRRPSWWDRFGETPRRIVANRTFVTIVLALTIIAVLALGFLASS